MPSLPTLKISKSSVRLSTKPECTANGGNLQRGPYLPFKSEYAQRDGVGCGGRQRLGEKVNARLSQVAQAV